MRASHLQTSRTDKPFKPTGTSPKIPWLKVPTSKNEKFEKTDNQKTTVTPLSLEPPKKSESPVLPKSLEEMQRLSGQEVYALRKKFGPEKIAEAVGSRVGEVSRGPEVDKNLENLNPLIAVAAQKYGIPQHLIESVMKKESGGKTNAVSPSGCLGPMQLSRYIYLKGGKGSPFKDDVNPFVPKQAIDRAGHHLALLYRKYDGDLYKTAAAYHEGEPKIDSLIDRYGQAWSSGLAKGLAKGYVEPIATEVHDFLRKYPHDWKESVTV